MKKSLILAVALVLAAAGSTYAGCFSWFHPFRHRRCENVVVCPQPVAQWVQYGIFKARFGETVECPFHHTFCHSDHWVYGYVNGDGWIYWLKEVPDPFHPGVVPDVEQVFKDLENDILNLFKRHHDRLVAPKVEDKK